MITSVTNFVQDSFQGQDRENMRSLVIGEVKLIVEHSNNAFIVVIFTGFESKELREDCRKILTRIEADYDEILEDWDGSRDSLSGIGEIIVETFKELGRA